MNEFRIFHAKLHENNKIIKITKWHLRYENIIIFYQSKANYLLLDDSSLLKVYNIDFEFNFI